jgi:hypothetical protein
MTLTAALSLRPKRVRTFMNTESSRRQCRGSVPRRRCCNRAGAGRLAATVRDCSRGGRAGYKIKTAGFANRSSRGASGRWEFQLSKSPRPATNRSNSCRQRMVVYQRTGPTAIGSSHGFACGRSGANRRVSQDWGATRPCRAHDVPSITFSGFRRTHHGRRRWKNMVAGLKQIVAMRKRRR